ncbi:MAG: penicillin-insensitive murein endopeptidase, partial [Polyangiaceae bacterium]|nr:penicillin-insensitive murein endopeptidase [Polyangiaceae bacterium]
AALAFALSLTSGAAVASNSAKEPKPASRVEASAEPRGNKGRSEPRRSSRAAREKPTGRDRGGEAARPKEKPRAKKPEVPAVSVGHPNDGRLEGGARLDDSLPYVRAVSISPGVDAQWGLPILVRMIERAAHAVAKRHPGSVLNVGDLSVRHGGEIGGHHSHESGRDADIGFYVTDAKGSPVDTRNFYKFEASLTTRQSSSVRFDLARNWLLIQSMLTDPAARVSHIFISDPLRRSLLEYARSRGVSRALLNRAAVVMMQPSGSLPHDDHIHVRISCPQSMAGECVEFAKNAPSKVAKARRRGAPLLTPGGARSTRGKEKAAPPAREAGKASKGEALAKVGETRPEGSGSALKPAFDGAAGGLLDAPRADGEGEAEASRTRDALLEGGKALD